MTSTASDMQFELKKNEDLKKSKENYKLRPLILLITETDGSPFEWFIRNQDKLYELGYRTINLEQCQEKSINTLLKNESNWHTLREAFMNGTYNSEKHLSNAYKFCKMEHYQHNMALFSLLKKLKSDEKFKRWRYNFIDVEWARIEKAESTKGIDSIASERNQNFASKISESCDKAQGGVVTILGNTHSPVYHILKDDINPICANFALCIDMRRVVLLEYNKTSTNFSVEEINKSRKASFVKKRTAVMDLIESQSYFPKGSFLSIDFSDDKSTAILDQIILKRVQELPENPKQTCAASSLPDNQNLSSSTEDLKSNSETLAFSSAMKAISQKEAAGSTETQCVEAQSEAPALGATKKKKKKKK